MSIPRATDRDFKYNAVVDLFKLFLAQATSGANFPSSHFSKRVGMRNRGPGQWREWRIGTQVVPLVMPDPKTPVPKDQKSVIEVGYLLMRALMAKNS